MFRNNFENTYISFIQTDEVRPKDVTISSKSDNELSTTIVQALLRSKKRDGIDLNNEHQGKVNFVPTICKYYTLLKV